MGRVWVGISMELSLEMGLGTMFELELRLRKGVEME